MNTNFNTYECVEKVNVSNLKRIIAHVRKKPELMKDPDVISQFKLLKNIESSKRCKFGVILVVCYLGFQKSLSFPEVVFWRIY